MNAATPLVNPWKGLHFYTEEDRELFFGRDRETKEFLRLVQRDTLSVLFARSGLGKTSLLRAGVIPQLRKQDFLPVIVRIDYAESAPPPTGQIVTAVLATAAAANVEVEPPEESGASLAEGQYTLWEFFHRYQFWGERNDLIMPVLILDQFEEAFTLGRSSPRTLEFLAQLADLAENRMPQSVQSRFETAGERPSFDTRAQNYKVVLSLREDYVPKLDSLRPIMPAVMRNRFALGPLGRERAVEVVLRAGGRWVSDIVTLEIVAAVAGDSPAPESEVPPYIPGTEIEPAYLSVMCNELFRRMTEQDKTEIDSGLVVEERGNILDGLYERSFTGLETGTRIFVEDRLLTATGFRGSVPLAEARREGVSIPDLECLVDSRLLRFEDRLGTTHVELSHDLLTPIVRKSRDERWAAAKVEAEREEERRREAEFAAKARAEARERVAKRLKFLTVTAVVASVVAVVFAILTSLALKIALSRGLATESYINANSSSQLSLLLASEAVSVSRTLPVIPFIRTLTEAKHAELANNAERVLRHALGAMGSTPLSGHGGPIFRMAFSPDGHTLASASTDRTIRLWDMTNPNPAAEPRVLRGHEDGVSAVAFSWDDHKLASAGRDGTIRLWDLTNPNPAAEPRILRGHESFVSALAFSPDGHTLASASGADRTIRLWDLTNPNPTAEPRVRKLDDAVSTVAFISSDGHTLASFSRDGAIRLWDWANLTPQSNPIQIVQTGLKGGAFVGASVAFSPDGHYFASASAERSISIWELTNPTAKPLVLPNASSEGSVLAVAFSPDGYTLVSASADRTVRLWNLASTTDSPKPRVVVRQQDITNVALSPDGHNLASLSWGDRIIRLWDLTTDPAVEPRVLSSQGDAALAVAFSPNSHILASADGEDHSIRLWDLNNSTVEPQVLREHGGAVSAMAFSPNGHTLASASTDSTDSTDSTIRLWDLTNPTEPKLHHTLPGHKDTVRAIAFSPNSDILVSAGKDHSIRLWDLTKPTPKPQVIGEQDDVVSALTFSPNDHTLASASADHTIRLWDLTNPATKAEPRILRGHEDTVLAIAFSPDGHILISAGKDRSIRRWDLTNPTPEPQVLREHDDVVSALAFSPDGHTLAAAGEDSMLRLWDLTALTAEPRVFSGHESLVSMLTFSPDGRTLASASADRTIRVWRTPIDDLLRLACDYAKRDLTPEEWQKYLGNETYHKTCTELPTSKRIEARKAE